MIKAPCSVWYWPKTKQFIKHPELKKDSNNISSVFTWAREWLHWLPCFWSCISIFVKNLYFSRRTYWHQSIFGALATNAYVYWNYILSEKCPYSDFFWSVFSRIRTKYGEIRSFSPDSVRMRRNMDQKNSKHRPLLCSDTCCLRVQLNF